MLQAWGLRPATLLKNETLAQVLSSEFCEIFMNTFFTEHLRATAREFLPVKSTSTKGTLMQLENLSIYSSSYENNKLKISH